MRYDAGVPVAVVAFLGMAAPPLATPAAAVTVAITLCSGGVIDLTLGSKGHSGDLPGGCHSACDLRRHDDEQFGDDGPA